MFPNLVVSKVKALALYGLFYLLSGFVATSSKLAEAGAFIKQSKLQAIL